MFVDACSLLPAAETAAVLLADSPTRVKLQVTGSDAESVNGSDEIGYAAAAAASDSSTVPGAGAGATA